MPTKHACWGSSVLTPECSLTESRIIWCVEKETSDVMPRDARVTLATFFKPKQKFKNIFYRTFAVPWPTVCVTSGVTSSYHWQCGNPCFTHFDRIFFLKNLWQEISVLPVSTFPLPNVRSTTERTVHTITKTCRLVHQNSPPNFVGYLEDLPLHSSAQQKSRYALH